MTAVQQPIPSSVRVELPCPYCNATGKVQRLYRGINGVPVRVRGKCSACEGRGTIPMSAKATS